VAAPAPAIVPAAPATPKAALVAPPAADSEAIAKAREAMRQKMTELNAQPPVEAAAVAPAAAKPVVAQSEAKPVAEKPAKKSTKVTNAPAFPPIQGPASSVSTDKQSRLDELLRKYRADQVTPEEYHVQRAKILAEP
jgi:hypothetical protein